MTETERQLMQARQEKLDEEERKTIHARITEEDRIYFRNRHFKYAASVAFTFFTVFAVFLFWFNGHI